GGALQIPYVTHALESFLNPTFADSKFAAGPSDALTAIGLVIGAVLALTGIAIAYVVYVLRPGTSAQLQERFAPLHRLFVNRWYFDELIDVLVVRPFS